ncbi:hypothetical protein [Spiroplasma alleghenense]|uniref:Uncharacterized protein n=1 Tax=Spiroplasma alleghenense TaxID=216931 RepID=A0A345Z2G0_9MOLU|nr:hypothetical protein [Spiroplasma alleghenense]AXK50789.1 hypothetical protein SALLE_v1c01130 [Spiroplasma alleghenense]
MKKASKITTLVGTSVTILQIFIAMIWVTIVISNMGEISSSTIAFGVGITLLISITEIVLSLLALIFILLKSKKINLVGYILSILAGVLAILIVPVPSNFGTTRAWEIITILAAITTVVGGILGIVFDRK